jgi:hypothetical protein
MIQGGCALRSPKNPLLVSVVERCGRRCADETILMTIELHFVAKIGPTSVLMIGR